MGKFGEECDMFRSSSEAKDCGGYMTYRNCFIVIASENNCLDLVQSATSNGSCIKVLIWSGTRIEPASILLKKMLQLCNQVKTIDQNAFQSVKILGREHQGRYGHLIEVNILEGSNWDV